MSSVDDLDDRGVVFGSNSAVKDLSYKSHSIFERRQRILREARLLIEKRGYEKFTVRELAKRADVAQATLYNAFGSRGSIIISAIYQYATEYAQNVNFENSAFSLLGRIERAIKAQVFNVQVRPYVAAIMAIYNAPGSDISVREAIANMWNKSHKDFAEYLAATQQFAPDINPQVFAEQLTRSTCAILSAWCYLEIRDEEMAETLVETMLMILTSSTKGAIRKEATEWLQALRQRSQPWLDLKARFEAPAQKATLTKIGARSRQAAKSSQD